MTVIRRWECPVHGSDTGMNYSIEGKLRCGAPVVYGATCATALQEVEYVPTSQLRGAVSEAVALLRVANGPQTSDAAVADDWYDRRDSFVYTHGSGDGPG